MKDAAAELVRMSLSRGAADAEAHIKTGAARTVSLVPGGRVNWTRSAEGGIALRLFLHDGSSGFASACGPVPEPPAADHLVAAALDAARALSARRAGGATPPLDLPAGNPDDGRGLGIFDAGLHAATPADMEGILDDAASEALAGDPRARRLDSASITAASSEVWLHNSRGLRGVYRQTLVHLSLGLVAADAARSVVVKRSRIARSLGAFSATLFGDETARLAALTLEGGPPLGEGVYPALLSPAAAAEILRVFAKTLTGEGAAPGATIGSRLLNVIDDGRLPGGCGTAPFDGEGVATRRTQVVSRGVLQEVIHDLESAAACGAVSTGNGLRGSFRDPPRRLPSNLFISPGCDGPDDLMADLDGALWIHSLRPTPALVRDGSMFLALATGRWVEKGRPASAFSRALLTWPTARLLEEVIGVGNDLTFGFGAGAFGSPSLLLRQIALSRS